MKAKPKPVVIVAPVDPQPQNWFRSMLTDHAGEFDTGRILVAVTVIGMLGLAWVDVGQNKSHFDPQAFGIGIGAVLAGFAAYLFGDAKRPEPGTTTTATASSTTVTK